MVMIEIRENMLHFGIGGACFCNLNFSLVIGNLYVNLGYAYFHFHLELVDILLEMIASLQHDTLQTLCFFWSCINIFLYHGSSMSN